MDDASCLENQFNAYAEATAALKDVSVGISFSSISTDKTLQPPPSNGAQYLNLRTLEGHDYCIRITTGGFQVYNFLFFRF